MAGKLKGSAIVDSSVTEQQLANNIVATLAQAANAYNQANAATGLAQTAYNQASLAYTAANNSANTVAVSQNGTSTLYARRINFVNTSTIVASVTDAISDANIELTYIGTTNYGDAFNQANLAYAQANVAYYISTNNQIQLNVVNTTFDSVNSLINVVYTKANNAHDIAYLAYAISLNAQGQSDQAYNQSNVAYNTALNAISTINGSVYPYINTVYLQANTAYDRANLALTTAVDASNTVTVSQNSFNTLFSRRLNFVSSANIGISVVDAGNGVANVVITGSAGNFVRVANDVTTNASFNVLFTTTTSGNVLSTNVSTSKLTFNPNTGTLSATTFNSLSDLSQKENVVTLIEASEMLAAMRGVRFTWKDNGNPSIGVIAQEVLKVAPEIVSRSQDGGYTVNYSGISAILIEAMKSMNSEIKELRAEIEKLKNVSSIK